MSDDERSDIGTQDTMYERANKSRLEFWVLLDGNRFLITLLLAAFVFVAFVLVGSYGSPPLAVHLASSDTVETMFSTMIGVLVTGTTLVVTINQLVISQENGPLGDQRKRMSDAMDFRTYTRDLLGETPPSDPSTFLRGLVQETQDRAETVRQSIKDHDDDDLRNQIDEFVDSVIGNSETVRDELENQSFGTFAVVSAALDFNYSWKLYQTERLIEEYDDDLTDDQRAALDDLQGALAMFGPAREHIKTLYFEWALIDLSRDILSIAVPALVAAGCMVAFGGQGVIPTRMVELGDLLAVVGVDATFPGANLGVSAVSLVVGAAFTLSLTPFLLFTAYVFRIATIAKRTLAIGPLVLRDSQL